MPPRSAELAGDEEEREPALTESERPDEGDGAEPEGEVVEVVGEVVDDAELDGEELDAFAPRSAVPISTSSPPASEAALSRSDPLQAYLREVQRHSLLTADEEKSLTQRYVQTQDVRTAARLVTANLRLVVKLAYEYRRAYKNIMDLIQEGN